MSIPWIVSSIVFFTLGGMALYVGLSTDVKSYLGTPEASGQILIAVLSVAIGILGIVWAFHAETERIRTIEANTFKRSFAALLYETGANHGTLNKLKNAIRPNQFNFLTLSTEIAKSLLANPLTYKYSGKEYTLSLSAYVTNVEIANKWLAFIWEDFKTDGNISEKNITDLGRQLDECMYYLLILQVQSQLYVHAHDVKLGPTPSNSEEIRAWLGKKTTVTIPQLEKKLLEMQNLEPKQRQELRKGLQSTVED